MKLSNRQKMVLHLAAKEAGCPGDEVRRSVQWAIGGFRSAADPTATRQGFIAVMAFWEARNGGKLTYYTRGYWAGEDKTTNPLDGLRWTLRQRAEALGLTGPQLDAFIAGEHMSNGACADVNAADAYWLRRTIIALDAIRKRKEQDRQPADRSAARPQGPAHSPAHAPAHSPPTDPRAAHG